MKKLITALLLTVALILPLQGAAAAKGAKPPSFCLDHPTHPQCQPSPTPTPIATPTPTPTPTPVATPTPTPSPTPTPTPVATPTPTPNPTPTPSPTPALNSVTVNTIIDLKAKLLDNSLDEIIVTNGTYIVSGATYKQATSLWMDSAYASRTRPIVIRAQTPGGVTFSGNGTTYWTGIAFVKGVHHQTWDGFNFANAEPTQTGAIVFGGTNGNPGPWPGAHHITLRNITIMGSITSTYAGSHDHSIYFSESDDGAHDILIDGYHVDGSGNVNTALTFYHSDNGLVNVWNVTVRNMTVTAGTYEAVEFWDDTIHDITIENATITGSKTAVRVEQSNTSSDIILKDITTINSLYHGFYSGAGTNPPGVTFINNNFDKW